MTTLELEDETLQIATVDCSEAELVVTLKDGRRIAVPLWWLPRLHHATPEQRADCAIYARSQPEIAVSAIREAARCLNIAGVSSREPAGSPR